MTFASTAMNKLSDTDYELKGKLTIHGISHDVKFKVEYGGTVKDSYNTTRAGFKATTVVNRFDYGLNWNKLTEAGGAVAGKDVNVVIRLELIKMK
jgi:polyisoprenoid-binding protein YceI